LEWHKKLEDLRLQEMRSRRLADRLKKEVQHFQDLSSAQAKRIEKLEEEVIKHETIMEQRQVSCRVSKALTEDETSTMTITKSNNVTS